MAIEFFSISNFDGLADVLSANCVGDNELFGSVTKDSNINCYDHDGNIVVVINSNFGGNAYAAQIGSSNYFAWGMPSDIVISKLYKTSKGIILMTNATAPDACVICKTNNGKIGICLFGTGSAGAAMYAARYTVAWGDITPLPNITLQVGTSSTLEEYQTILQPIPTHPALGVISYLDGAYFLPQSQSRSEGTLIANGKQYVTNGYIALLDE